MNCKRLVISGAGGFLGSNIIRQAAAIEGLEILAITSDAEKLKEVTGCAISTIDTAEYLEKGYDFSEGDVFINCLFPTNADGFRMADGLNKVYRMINVSKESGIGSFINISSQSVYDPKRTYAASEDSDICLETPYAVGKYSTEILTNTVFKDMPHTNIRLASLLGVGYGQRIVNRMAAMAMKGEDLKVMGGMQRYGFLDVRDAAAGIIKLALGGMQDPDEAYNLGVKSSYSLIDVAELITKAVNEQLGMNVKYIITEGEDHRNSALDATKFMEYCNWTPAISIEQTVNDIVADLAGKQ